MICLKSCPEPKLTFRIEQTTLARANACTYNYTVLDYIINTIQKCSVGCTTSVCTERVGCVLTLDVKRFIDDPSYYPKLFCFDKVRRC